MEIKSGDANHLVVMPPKFALPAGSSKTVRFVAMEPEQQEKTIVLSLKLYPALMMLLPIKKISMQLTVNLIWGIVVSVPPQQPVTKLEINSAKKLLNAGNQRLKVLTIAYCKNNSKDNSCKTQTVNKNIFPGQEKSLESISGYDKIVVKYNNWITKDNGEFELAVH